MTNKSKSGESRRRRKTDPARRVLGALVLPVFEEEAGTDEDGSLLVELCADGEEVFLRGILDRDQLVIVRGQSLDHERTSLRISWLAGLFLGDIGMHVLFVGALLEATPFHVQGNVRLGTQGEMMVGCDLVVRGDDEPLIRQRISELLSLTRSMELYFPLRLPNRLRWMDVQDMEIPWEDLPHGELEEFLDAALHAPRSERTPRILLRVAQALCRWKDVLRLLREHPEEFTPFRMAPIKAMANRELRRWLPALKAAEEGGIRDGRYPGGPWLSPSYMHSLIEAGDDIEALKLLGRPEEDEPGFYDWLRGLALHRAGDLDGSETAFARYFYHWAGDVIGLGTTPILEEE